LNLPPFEDFSDFFFGAGVEPEEGGIENSGTAGIEDSDTRGRGGFDRVCSRDVNECIMWRRGDIGDKKLV